MSYSTARQSNEESSLKDVLITILENLGVSKLRTESLEFVFDTNFKAITDKNDKNLFKFENTDISYDFGEAVNEKIKSSYIMVYLNNQLSLKKIEIHFLTVDLEVITLVKYNSNYEVIDLIYLEVTKEFEERMKLLKIEEEKIEYKRIEAYKLLASHAMFTKSEKNKKIIDEIKNRLELLTDNGDDFKYICDYFLSTNAKYEKWNINNNKNFTISEYSNKLEIETNIFNTNIVSCDSKSFVQNCKISFDTDIKISNFNFVIKQVKLGDYWMYSFDLDSNLNLIKYSRIDLINGKIQSTKKLCDGLTFEELVSILKFKLSYNDGIYEIIPEVVIPSAYNFNTEDFKKRLLIAEMLLV